MKINDIVKQLCAREGKKKQVNIAQMREIVNCLSDMLYANYTKLKVDPSEFEGATDFIDVVLFNHGKKRAKKASKK